MVVCEKCQDTGFIELDKIGLLTEFCDCEIGKALEARKRAIYGIPENGDDLNEPDNGDDLWSPNGDNQPRALILPHYEGDDRSLEERADEAHRIIEASKDSRIKQPDSDTRKPDTSKSKQPQKPKKKKKPRKRAK